MYSSSEGYLSGPSGLELRMFDEPVEENVNSQILFEKLSEKLGDLSVALVVKEAQLSEYMEATRVLKEELEQVRDQLYQEQTKSRVTSSRASSGEEDSPIRADNGPLPSYTME